MQRPHRHLLTASLALGSVGCAVEAPGPSGHLSGGAETAAEVDTTATEATEASTSGTESDTTESGEVLDVGGGMPPAEWNCETAAEMQGSVGCEYYVPTPPFRENSLGAMSKFDGACHALFLVNDSEGPAQVTVSFGGVSYDVTAFGRMPDGIGEDATYQPIPASGIPAGEVAVLFLSHELDAANGNVPLTCPVEPAIVGNTVAFGTDSAEAFEVVSDSPVVAYDILPYGGALSFLPSASLLYPRTSWGSNYVLNAPRPGAEGESWALVVAREDDTEVTISATTGVDEGGIAAPTIGAPQSYSINAGQTLQWSAGTGELAGSIIGSNKPIAVFTGNTYLTVPTADSPSGGGRDAAHQQLTPVSALGSEYVSFGVPTRRLDMSAESVRYRLVGVVDGTELSYDPEPPPGAPTELELSEVVEFETTSFFSVSSQGVEHPFSLTQYMGGSFPLHLPGCAVPMICAWLGDEDWVNIIAPAQFVDQYVFFVDPTYGTANLSLVRTRGKDGFEAVELDCYGTVDGWSDIGEVGDFQVAHIDLYRESSGPCAQSRVEARSDAPFGVIVWGTDLAASYGYPAGGRTSSLNDVMVPVD